MDLPVRVSKRPYEPSIAAYFTYSQSSKAALADTNTSRLSRAASSHSNASTIPERVQTSLLSVGMRVRKAVAGGYQREPLKELANARSAAYVQAQSRRPAELAPFSALHAVGGYDVQQKSADWDEPNIQAAMLDPRVMDLDCPGLTMSQESVDSTCSNVASVTPSRKRVHDEAGDELGLNGNELGMQVFVDSDLVLGGMASTSGARIIAKPRTRRRLGVPRTWIDDYYTPDIAEHDVMDFEDATFLHPLSDGE